MFPSRPQVEQIAPDAASIKAAGKVSSPGKWRGVGTGESAVWGVCVGSREYQVQVDLRDLASRCSCPSRKFPCKHALGLLLLSSVVAPPTGEPPEWVTSWLTGRRNKAAAARSPKDENLSSEELEAAEAKRAKGRAKRLAQRESHVSAGVEALDLWLRDLVRAGISDLDAVPQSFFEDRSQALGDAQAPGLRRRVAEIGELPGSGSDWPQQVLDRLGQLALLTDAWQRQATLPEPLRTDLRTAIGFPRKKEHVLAEGERVEDRWVIVGQQVEELELTFSERTWLLGESSGRSAVVVRHARGPTGFGPILLPGTTVAAVLAYYPSALLQRAVVAEREEGMSPAVTLPVSALDASVSDHMERCATAYSAVPWVGLLPCGLVGVTPLRTSRGEWWVRDAVGHGLRLHRGDHWTLLAVSGGQPVDLFGEWDGRRLRPLSVSGEHGLRRLDVSPL